MRHLRLPETPKEHELTEKARLLREAPYFVGVNDDVLSEKRYLFLVLAGLKPVAEVVSGHWVPTPTGRRTVPDDPVEVGKFLDSLGLAYQLHTDDHGTDAVVALSPELVQEYESAANIAADIGRLFGYPDTAVRAFGTDGALSHEEQEAIERDAGLPWPGVPFRLSRDHWQEEIEVVRKWWSVAREYGFGPPPSTS